MVTERNSNSSLQRSCSSAYSDRNKNNWCLQAKTPHYTEVQPINFPVNLLKENPLVHIPCILIIKDPFVHSVIYVSYDSQNKQWLFL
jgi:hypothetical protein